jgi:hypothetical protein
MLLGYRLGFELLPTDLAIMAASAVMVVLVLFA